MCDVGYLCANFGLPRPLCSRLRPEVRDRQTDRRQTKVLVNVHAGLIMHQLPEHLDQGADNCLAVVKLDQNSFHLP